MRNHDSIITIDHVVNFRQCSGYVRVLVLTDKITDMAERNNLFDFVEGLIESQSGARVN